MRATASVPAPGAARVTRRTVRVGHAGWARAGVARQRRGQGCRQGGAEEGAPRRRRSGRGRGERKRRSRSHVVLLRRWMAGGTIGSAQAAWWGARDGGRCRGGRRPRALRRGGSASRGRASAPVARAAPGCALRSARVGAQPVAQGLAARRQAQRAGAPVLGIDPPLDVAGGGEAVDEVMGAHRIDPQPHRQAALVDAPACPPARRAWRTRPASARPAR